MRFFDKKAEISEYNLVNESNYVLPNYSLYNSELSVEIRMSPEQEVCIIGKIDNNYLCWYSITSINDLEVNEKIFNYLTTHQFVKYSNESAVLENEKYKEIRDWYWFEFKRSEKDLREWLSPFSSAYGAKAIPSHGNFFANDLKILYHSSVQKSHLRTMGGYYKELLTEYLSLLNKEAKYENIETLMSILKSESYLRLSPDVSIRELYLECIKRGNELYNRYMDRTR